MFNLLKLEMQSIMFRSINMVLLVYKIVFSYIYSVIDFKFLWFSKSSTISGCKATHDLKIFTAYTPFLLYMVSFNRQYVQIMGEDEPVGGALLTMESRLALRLPPASPFDNFLRAARQH